MKTFPLAAAALAMVSCTQQESSNLAQPEKEQMKVISAEDNAVYFALFRSMGVEDMQKFNPAISSWVGLKPPQMTGELFLNYSEIGITGEAIDALLGHDPEIVPTEETPPLVKNEEVRQALLSLQGSEGLDVSSLMSFPTIPYEELNGAFSPVYRADENGNSVPAEEILPDHGAVITLSRVGYSDNGSVAVLRMSLWIGPMAAFDSYHVLYQKDGEWSDVRRWMILGSKS